MWEWVKRILQITNIAKFMISVFHRVEHNVGMEKMLVTSIFSFFDNVFKRPFSRSLKVGIVW